MNAQQRYEQMGFDEYREWFQAQVYRLYESSGPLAQHVGKVLRYAIMHCESGDIMPRSTRETLKEIGDSVFHPLTVDEPCTYKQGAALLRKCLRHDASRQEASR